MPDFDRPGPVNEPDSDSSFDPFTLFKKKPQAEFKMENAAKDPFDAIVLD